MTYDELQAALNEFGLPEQVTLKSFASAIASW